MDITTIARNTMTTAEEWVINADHDDAGMRNLMNERSCLYNNPWSYRSACLLSEACTWRESVSRPVV